jgi:hypothetical protein
MTVSKRRVCRLLVDCASERLLSATSRYGRCWPVSACRAQQRSDTACKMKSRLRHCSTATARVWPKRCIHAERRGLMQISGSRYVLLLPLPSHPRDVKTESTRNAVLFGLHPPFSSYRPLNWRTGSAILKSLVREHRAHTAFMSTGHPAMHEVQYLGIGVALEAIPILSRKRLRLCARSSARA